MSQNNFMYEWKKAKEHYDQLADGSIQIHEDAPDNVKRSYHEYERIMGKVTTFPDRRNSLFSMLSNKKSTNQDNVVREPKKSVHRRVSNVKAIFDNESKKKIVGVILEQLPNMFLATCTKEEYIENCSTMPFWASYEEGKPVGFIAIKKHNDDCAEIYGIGVLKEEQGKHIAKSLLAESESWCLSDGITYLQVKTVSEDVDDAEYANLRAFYDATNFKALEVFPTFWNNELPCLIMIKKL